MVSALKQMILSWIEYLTPCKHEDEIHRESKINASNDWGESWSYWVYTLKCKKCGRIDRKKIKN